MTEKELLALMEEVGFPPEPRVDWEGTNHFEIQDPSASPENDRPYWWFDLSDVDVQRITSNTPLGRAMGCILELAAYGARALRDKMKGGGE